MADFRRCMIVLAALALLLGTVSTVSAAGFQCQTNAATPQQARQQGITELMGDLVLNCTGGVNTTAGATVPTVNITVTLNTEVTSRLIDTDNNGTEAILLADEPAPGTQHVCFAADAPCPMTSQGAIATSPYLPTAGGTTTGTDINKNVFQGQWNSNQPGSIVFRGVPIDPPGTARALLVFRVTNVRGNATRFAVSTGVGIGGIPIYMTIAVSNPSAVPINNPQQIVAFVFNGLVQGQDDEVSFKQCNDVNVDSGKLKYLAQGPAGLVKAIEGFASAFKIRDILTTPAAPTADANQDVPGTNYPAVESGFWNNTDDADFADAKIAGAGAADAGTRIKVEFANVPVGVHVFVPVTITNGKAIPLVAQLVKNEAGAYSAATASSTFGGGLSEVTISGGAGMAVYEILAEDPANTEELDIPVEIAYIANPAGNSPSITSGPATAGVSFAPTTTPPDYTSNTSPVPRFLDTATQANRFIVNACRTNLLYPFVTNQAGYDTGLAIANTSQDPYGTLTQHGTCDLNFFNGSTTPPPPAKFTTADVGAGSVYTNLLSIVAPGFQGYIIAVCNFQYAHGYAFLLGGTPGSANQVAQGYIALIIPDPGRGIGASGFDKADAGSGEMLGF